VMVRRRRLLQASGFVVTDVYTLKNEKAKKDEGSETS
jgi:hypothetical protein